MFAQQIGHGDKKQLALSKAPAGVTRPVALLFGVLTTILILLFHRKQQQGCSYVERAKGEIADKLSTSPPSQVRAHMGTYCRSRHIGIATERVRHSYAIHGCSRPACADALRYPLLDFMLYPCNTAAPKRDSFGKEPIGDVLIDGRSAQACGVADVGESNEAHGSDPVWLVQTISDRSFFFHVLPQASSFLTVSRGTAW